MADMQDIRADFIEKVGQISQREHMPRIAGRVLGLLIFNGHPVSFGELAEELQVSRGSISSSVRMLEDRGVIRRIGLPGERQDFFELAAPPFAGFLEGAQRRIKQTRREINETLDALPDDARGPQCRIKAYSDFYATIGMALGHALEQDLAADRV